MSHLQIIRNDTTLQVADLIGNAPDWQEQALCQQTDPEAFYPEEGQPGDAAKRICRRCNVRAECLEYALDRQEAYGIWGGLSGRQRRALKQQNAQPGQVAA